MKGWHLLLPENLSCVSISLEPLKRATAISKRGILGGSLALGDPLFLGDRNELLMLAVHVVFIRLDNDPDFSRICILCKC